MEKDLLGPNLKKLAIHKCSIEAIPPGGGIAAGIKFLTEPGWLAKSLKEAISWARASILTIRQAPEPNPWKDASEEEIAGEILRRLKQKK